MSVGRSRQISAVSRSVLVPGRLLGSSPQRGLPLPEPLAPPAKLVLLEKYAVGHKDPNRTLRGGEQLSALPHSLSAYPERIASDCGYPNDGVPVAHRYVLFGTRQCWRLPPPQHPEYLEHIRRRLQRNAQNFKSPCPLAEASSRANGSLRTDYLTSGIRSVIFSTIFAYVTPFERVGRLGQTPPYECRCLRQHYRRLIRKAVAHRDAFFVRMGIWQYGLQSV